MEGHIISHYRILERLGGGGMGIVYKAEDTRLKRPVALKFLPPELTRDEDAKRRFVQEAQAASSLDHPNICTIYEIDETADGQMFLAMAYYEGHTLKKRLERGALELEEAVDIAVQVGQGLARAHESSIIHRDIKPANVMLTHRREVKVVDFGLAKLVGQTGLTQLGTALGTVAYMSPEQARGQEVDDRTDIWSLAVVLYEMIAREQPFKGASAQAVIYAILNNEPEPLQAFRSSVPLELERIVVAGLSKERSRRRHAGEMLLDLRDVRRQLEGRTTRLGSTTDLPSVAVLPFSDMSAERDQEYFCEGMAEELINGLTNLGGLRVASRTSALQFKGQAQDIRRIGKQLDVETVLEGSVRKAGNRVRITAQLVNVLDGYQLWSERYDREMDDLFSIQDQIARAIVDKLKVKLMTEAQTPLVKRHTHNLEAYNLYLKGRYYWSKRTNEGLKKGVQLFQQAIDEDPAYALAYVGLADSYHMLAVYSALAPREAIPKAKAAAAKALEFDESLAEAHTSLGRAAFFDFDWHGAEREFSRAMELNAGYATTHNWYALYFAITGRLDEAIAEARRARELDPLSLIINADMGRHCYFRREYDEAIEHLRAALELDPTFGPTYFFLGQAYEQKSMFGEAVAAFQKALSLAEESSRPLAALAHAYAISGSRDEAHKVLGELIDLGRTKYVSPLDIAAVYTGLDEKDQAFEWLEKALEDRSVWMWFLKVEPRYDRLRSDPRFQDLLRRMNFPE